MAVPPAVSIIVPCYNEQATIRLLLDALSAQTFPPHQMEILIADGMSTDCTRDEIAAFAAGAQPAVQVLDNPARTIPAALNTALRAARGGFIVRLDAHAVPAPDYVARCVAALQAGTADNVGGVWEIAPGADTPVARAIAVAAAHPLGVGDAHYRHATAAQYVDTVPFGAFRRRLVDEIGFFDEGLLTNEDYEFNTRLRQQGGKIWLDPAIRSTYFARATLGALARQYLRYGYWKGVMLKRYPASLRWRQALPPLFAAGLLALIGLGAFFGWARLALGLVALIYLGALTIAGGQAAWRRRDFALFWGIPAAIAVMHLSWGGALLWSLVRPR
jgi:glycosyltransferase involved in cell wall biosynthesis